jgi:hypothetical protein
MATSAIRPNGTYVRTYVEAIPAARKGDIESTAAVA